MKRPNRFPQSLVGLTSLSTHGLQWIRVTVKPVRSELASVVARVEGMRSNQAKSERQVEGCLRVC